jgi:endonuclease G
MKRYLFYAGLPGAALTLAAASILVACNDKTPVTESVDPVRVRFSADIEVVTTGSEADRKTRAIDENWTEGDLIGIFMAEAGRRLDVESIAEEVDNVPYATDGTGEFLPDFEDDTIYFPIQGSVDFYAYYPYNKAVVDYKYTVDVSDQSNQQALDFMLTDKIGDRSKDTPAVELDFEHMMSKIVLNIAPGEGLVQVDLDNLVVTVADQITVCDIDIATGTFNHFPESRATITLNPTTTGVLHEAILIPGAMAGSSRTFTFNLANGKDEPFDWTMTVPLHPGTKYTYDVTLNRTESDLTGTILPWKESDGGDVVAE